MFSFDGMPVARSPSVYRRFPFFLQHPELPSAMIVQLPISQTQNIADARGFPSSSSRATS
jgi:hypothetical protein